MEANMVEATQAYHPKVLNAIRVIAEMYARQEAKEQIRHRGQKVSDYLPKEINIMGHLLLVADPQRFVDRAKASAVIKEIAAEIEAKERRRLERKSKHLNNSSGLAPQGLPLNVSHAQNGAPK
jgi:hypothetical protein